MGKEKVYGVWAVRSGSAGYSHWAGIAERHAEVTAIGFLPLSVFSVPTECAAITAGDDLRGLGTCHQQASSRNSGNGNPAKYAILRKIALLASSFDNLRK